jgi:hypothetical protein
VFVERKFDTALTAMAKVVGLAKSELDKIKRDGDTQGWTRKWSFSHGDDRGGRLPCGR